MEVTQEKDEKSTDNLRAAFVVIALLIGGLFSLYLANSNAENSELEGICLAGATVVFAAAAFFAKPKGTNFSYASGAMLIFLSVPLAACGGLAIIFVIVTAFFFAVLLPAAIAALLLGLGGISIATEALGAGSGEHDQGSKDTS